jgi:acetyl esterase/lipase
MILQKKNGAETGVFEGLRADWEANNISFYEDVVYGQGGGHDLYLDLMIPNESTEQPRAVIVWIHGGGWTSADLNKKYRPTKALIDACKAGFVCVSIDYRLVTEKPFPAPIEDCKCAIRFLKAHAQELGIDPERIGVWGESAGGQLAALVGASYNNPRIEGNGGWNDYSSEVKAVCDWYCGGDMTFMGANQNKVVLDRAKELGIKLSSLNPEMIYGPKSKEQLNDLIKMFFGKHGKDASELAMDISPIFYVDQKQPAYLLMHGDSDQLVPIEFSYNFNDALLSHGHDVTFIIIPKQGHGFFTGQGYYDIIINFFKKYLLN